MREKSFQGKPTSIGFRNSQDKGMVGRQLLCFPDAFRTIHRIGDSHVFGFEQEA
jgi:hypothetical protein